MKILSIPILCILLYSPLTSCQEPTKESSTSYLPERISPSSAAWGTIAGFHLSLMFLSHINKPTESGTMSNLVDDSILTFTPDIIAGIAAGLGAASYNLLFSSPQAIISENNSVNTAATCAAIIAFLNLVLLAKEKKNPISHVLLPTLLITAASYMTQAQFDSLQTFIFGES